MVENEKKDIELRSEKVRNIVGKIPPVLLRSGISIITLIIILAIIGAYFMPYPEYVHLKLKVYADTTKTSGETAMIPVSIGNICIGYASGKVKDKIRIGQQVEIKISATKEIVTGYVSKIYLEPMYIDYHSIYKIEISIYDLATSFKDSGFPFQEGEATIQVSDKSILKRFMESIGL